MSDFNPNIYGLEHRLDQFGLNFGEFNELIDYGSFDPEFIVVYFLLSDDEESKNDRHYEIISDALSSEKKCTI